MASSFLVRHFPSLFFNIIRESDEDLIGLVDDNILSLQMMRTFAEHVPHGEAKQLRCIHLYRFDPCYLLHVLTHEYLHHVIEKAVSAKTSEDIDTLIMESDWEILGPNLEGTYYTDEFDWK